MQPTKIYNNSHMSMSVYLLFESDLLPRRLRRFYGKCCYRLIDVVDFLPHVFGQVVDRFKIVFIVSFEQFECIWHMSSSTTFV